MTQLGAEPASQSTPQIEPAAQAPVGVSDRKVASSAIWRATETAGNELIAFMVFALLARLLSLEDVGVVALASSIMEILRALLYHGFTEALIQKPDVHEEHHHTVMAANTGLAIVLVGLGAVGAIPLSWLLGRSEFQYIFWALLPTLLFRGMSSPMLASLRRDMEFKAIAIRTLAGVVIGGILAVILAMRGAGYWALVVQQWSSELVGFLVLARVSPTKPWRMRWNAKAMSELLPVALPVMGTAFLSIAARRLDVLALGFFQPNSVVAIYSMTNRLVFAAQMVTQHGLSEVAMVVLSSMNRDLDAAGYRKGLLRAMRLMSYVCAWAFGLLAVAGPWLVPYVFGAKWAPTADALRVLSALTLGGAVVSIAGVTLVASGYAGAFGRLQIGMAFAQSLAVLVAAHMGLMPVVWAVGLMQCIAMVPALKMLVTHYELSWRELLAELVPMLALFSAGLAAAHWIRLTGDSWYTQPLAVVAFCVLMGIAARPVLRSERAHRVSMMPPEEHLSAGGPTN